MRNCFRRLEERGVRYLLISGQAAVLYGGATFSEDVDFWVDPTADNVAALTDALRAIGASVYKLTPPLDAAYFRRGHGFHFRIPPEDGLPTYVDVMGQPPRVGGFARAARRSVSMDTPWGTIPVVGIEDLVALKRTRRLADYDVITDLVRLALARSIVPAGTKSLRWALDNCFRVEDALWLVNTFPRGADLARRSERRIDRALFAARSAPTAGRLARMRTLLAAEIARHQQADVVYWASIVAELKQLRRSGSLLGEGSPV